MLERSASISALRPPTADKGPDGAKLQYDTSHVLGRHEVVGDHDHLVGVEDLVDAHLGHRAERDRARDVVRHHDVAAHHDQVADGDLVGVTVREQDLLSERVRH